MTAVVTKEFPSEINSTAKVSYSDLSSYGHSRVQ